MDVFIARQPIFDRKKQTVAYELLFRGGLQNAMPDIDGDAATAKVLSIAFLNLGLDTLSGRRPVAINFTQELLEKEVPLLLPQQTTTVEVLSDVLPTAKVVECCRKMAARGYHVTLDEFGEHDPREALLHHADSVKIDVLNNDWQVVTRLAQHGAQAGKLLIASKVEDIESFTRCAELGFERFQGYFFRKPKLFSGSDLSASKVSLLRMLAEINRNDFDFERLQEIITHDVSTSYKLLRYINSSLFKRPREITSIKQAMVLLGQREVRRFLSLVVTATLASDRPSELMRDACIKAQFGALIVSERHGICTPDEMFTVGLFSNIDAILDQPINEIMNKLPLEAHMKDALVDGSGEMGALLSLINAYLRGRWRYVAILTDKLRIDDAALHNHYREACEWANNLF